jgi:hypothetical protein
MSIGFSKTFGLEREILSRALSEFEGSPRLSRSELMSRLGVGSQKAEAMVLWLGKLGLRDNREGQLTPLGTLLLRYDPYLKDIITLWLLHYQVASNPDAEVWYVLTNRFLPSRTEFRFTDALNFLVSQGLRTVADKHLKADVSIFLRAFMLEEGLGKMGFLTAREGGAKMAQLLFHKSPPTELSPYLVAYAIFDQRTKTAPNVATVTIEELLTRDGSVGRVFALNRSRLEQILRLISSSQFGRLVEVSTTAGLDQVGLRFRGSPIEILEMNYKSRAKAELVPKE